MRIVSGAVRLAATDVSNHLACHHLTNLEVSVARGERSAPKWQSPEAVVIRERGLVHEKAYLQHLTDQGIEALNLSDVKDEAQLVQETLQAMKNRARVIVQGALSNGDWFGQPDILRRTERKGRSWTWSYEAVDCKLARETKAATVLQLSFYSELLEQIQGVKPEEMHVVVPGRGFKEESFRVEEYSAYYRRVKDRLRKGIEGKIVTETYPEPCAHCDVCRWFRECEERRATDDHLSLVAGISHQQRNQLQVWNVDTVAKLAVLPIPLKEKLLHGSKEAMEHVREQARVQIGGKGKEKPIHELLPVEKEVGLCRLPAPSPGDVFLDLEGDPFAGDQEAGGGQEYLFGFVACDGCAELKYEKQWALSAQEEKAGFEWLVDAVMGRLRDFPEMHLYHYGAYEPSALKRLMGRYDTRQDEVDRLLRGKVFVDLRTMLKQAMLVSVDEYSLKKLEALYGFERKVPRDISRAAMRFVEHGLELGWDVAGLTDEYRSAMEAYNEEDCLSAARMRDWLEERRANVIQSGVEIARPALGDGTPPADVDERQKRVAELTQKLKEGISEDRARRTDHDQARWLLASLLDWHRREDKAVWWDYYRLRDMKDEALMEDRSGLAGLQHVVHVGMQGRLTVERYTFPKQETEIRRGDKVCQGELNLGTVQRIDIADRTIEIKRTQKTAKLHPTSIFVDGRGPKWDVLANSIFEVGNRMLKDCKGEPVGSLPAWDLLRKNRPRLKKGESIDPIGAETTVETGCRIASALEDSVFAIQGPPGAGKTFTGARMICRLVREGKKVGITAHGHKAIGKVLKEVQIAADEADIKVRCIRKISEDAHDDEIEGVEATDDNEIPLARLQSGMAQVAAGTAWMWARPEYACSIDALLIDEAGQMALADVVAAAQAARNLILIGDPQQLQRPLKGSHPEGAEKSALQHLIGDQKTISPDVGMLLPMTRRMHPEICKFTSESFYEGKLQSHPVTHTYALGGHPTFSKAGLYFVPVSHDGNQNSSVEEVGVVARIAESLFKPGVKWVYGIGNARPLDRKEKEDVLIVAPYNAQVSDLSERLPGMNIGTVDKFQGQQAAVVIYSLTTSSPEDAPHGMEFLYSLNRFNVATSRARAVVIVVGSPKLFEPECKSPRQMQLANAFCAYLERATTVEANLV